MEGGDAAVRHLLGGDIALGVDLPDLGELSFLGVDVFVPGPIRVTDFANGAVRMVELLGPIGQEEPSQFSLGIKELGGREGPLGGEGLDALELSFFIVVVLLGGASGQVYQLQKIVP